MAQLLMAIIKTIMLFQLFVLKWAEDGIFLLSSNGTVINGNYKNNNVVSAICIEMGGRLSLLFGIFLLSSNGTVINGNYKNNNVVSAICIEMGGRLSLLFGIFLLSSNGTVINGNYKNEEGQLIPNSMANTQEGVGPF